MTKHHAMQYRYLHILMILMVYLKDILILQPLLKLNNAYSYLSINVLNVLLVKTI